MGLIQDQKHLTVVDPEFETTRKRTYPGMAHFAGSGPKNTCRECVYWSGCGGENGYYAKRGIYGGQIKPRSCARYRDMMQGDIGPGVPHDAMACKYFELDTTPPPIFEKR